MPPCLEVNGSRGLTHTTLLLQGGVEAQIEILHLKFKNHFFVGLVLFQGLNSAASGYCIASTNIELLIVTESSPGQHFFRRILKKAS